MPTRDHAQTCAMRHPVVKRQRKSRVRPN
jgi:hypothetical protein